MALKNCSHCGATPQACAIKVAAALDAAEYSIDRRNVSDKVKAEMRTRTAQANTCCRNCQHVN